MYTIFDHKNCYNKMLKRQFDYWLKEMDFDLTSCLNAVETKVWYITNDYHDCCCVNKFQNSVVILISNIWKILHIYFGTEFHLKYHIWVFIWLRHWASFMNIKFLWRCCRRKHPVRTAFPLLGFCGLMFIQDFSYFKNW